MIVMPRKYLFSYKNRYIWDVAIKCISHDNQQREQIWPKIHNSPKGELRGNH